MRVCRVYSAALPCRYFGFIEICSRARHSYGKVYIPEQQGTAQSVNSVKPSVKSQPIPAESASSQLSFTPFSKAAHLRSARKLIIHAGPLCSRVALAQ